MTIPLVTAPDNRRDYGVDDHNGVSRSPTSRRSLFQCASARIARCRAVGYEDFRRVNLDALAVDDVVHGDSDITTGVALCGVARIGPHPTLRDSRIRLTPQASLGDFKGEPNSCHRALPAVCQTGSRPEAGCIGKINGCIGKINKRAVGSFAHPWTQVPATRAAPAKRHVAAAIFIACVRQARQPSLS